MLNFELVSPEKILVSREVAMVTVPGSEGDFGVLPGHAPLMAQVRSGLVDVLVAEGEAVQRIFIAGGFAEVTFDRCTVLCEEAVPFENLDRALLEAELKAVQTEFAASHEQEVLASLSAKIERLEAKLSVLR